MSPITLLLKSDGYAKTKAENKIKRGIAEHSCTIFSRRPPTDILPPLFPSPFLIAIYRVILS